MVNDSIYTFIKRVKLENAAFKLRTKKRKSITDIALEAGYSPSNFAAAFKAYFGMSASRYRNSGDVPVKESYLTVAEAIRSLKKQEDFFRAIDFQITIRRIEAMNLEYRRFIGNYREGLRQAWCDFCAAMAGKHPLGPNTQSVGISYDDPLITDENRCIYDMCLPVNEVSCIHIHKIPAGDYACYEFHDRLENLITGFNRLFALWMPFCGYDLDDRPCLELYRSGLDDAGRIHLEICVPLRK